MRLKNHWTQHHRDYELQILIRQFLRYLKSGKQSSHCLLEQQLLFWQTFVFRNILNVEIFENSKTLEKNRFNCRYQIVYQYLLPIHRTLEVQYDVRKPPPPEKNPAKGQGQGQGQGQGPGRFFSEELFPRTVRYIEKLF